MRSVPLFRSLGILATALACAATASCGSSTDDAFLATDQAGGKLFTIEVREQNKVSMADVGPLGTEGCASIARAADGTLYSMCGSTAKPGPQQLARIDAKTGKATPFGGVVDGLMVMGLEFGADGTLYAAGDANGASPTFNSLYTVDVKTGALTRVGSMGVPAPAFFMDFAVDRNGTMYGATARGLYTIDLKTGTATKVVDFVGGGDIMGLAFDSKKERLYATDFKMPNSALYLVDTHTGFLTPIAATGHGFAHGLVPSR